MSSSSRVLSIPELLDNILHHSAPKDLFCQQRVNKTWQALVQTSTPLQDKMFFRSAVREHKDREGIAYKSYVQVVVAEWNPFLAPFVRHTLPKNSHLGCIIDPNALRNLELACPNATWKKMVITKPALQRMNISRNNSELLVPGEPLRNNDGITLGDLSQAAIRHESHWYLASQGPKVTIPDYHFQLNPAVGMYLSKGSSSSD